MRTGSKIAAVVTAVAASMSMASAASADTAGPAVKYFKSALPKVGSVLSNSSGTPSFSIKDGWAVNDGDGICSAYTNLYKNWNYYSRVWNAPNTGKSVTSLIGNTATWTTQVGEYDELDTYAQDCLGNNSSSYSYNHSSLAQEGAASYGAGWSTSSGSVFSGGAVEKSSTVGAKATYSFSNSTLVSLISDKASNRGKVSLSVDGGAAKTVDLSGATLNRVIVWNSPYLTSGGTHLLTVKVVSGRVDIDGFLTQSTY